MKIPSAPDLLAVAKSAGALLGSIPKRDPEYLVVREYCNAVRRGSRLMVQAKANSQRRAFKGMASRQAERAKKWDAIAAAHYPLVQKIIGGDKCVPVAFVESLSGDAEILDALHESPAETRRRLKMEDEA